MDGMKGKEGNKQMCKENRRTRNLRNQGIE
jgi:hypothetical protein